MSLRCARSATGTRDGLAARRTLERVATNVFLGLRERWTVGRGEGDFGVGSKGGGSSLNNLLQKSAAVLSTRLLFTNHIVEVLSQSRVLGGMDSRPSRALIIAAMKAMG
jgi:hypothetical protein